MTLYRVSNDNISIGLISDDGHDYGEKKGRGRHIIDAPPFARWAIGKETYHVLKWFRQRGFRIQSKRVS